jgi:hypothetical protein
MELANIPGFQEAVGKAEAEEASRRDLSLHAEVHLEICGVAVCQLTPRHLLRLFACDSPFVTGAAHSGEHIGLFLWIVSPEFTPDPEARRAFIERTIDLPGQTTLDAINDYLESALMDRPAGNSSPRVPIVSGIASLCHRFAAAYRWDDELTLDKPIARLYQYLRLITLDESPTAVFFNRLSDRAKREVINDWKAKQKRKAARQRKKKGMATE